MADTVSRPIPPRIQHDRAWQVRQFQFSYHFSARNQESFKVLKQNRPFCCTNYTTNNCEILPVKPRNHGFTLHRIGHATLPIIAFALAASAGVAKAETLLLTCRTHNLKSGIDETPKFEIDEQRFFINGEPWSDTTVTIGTTAINVQKKFSTISVDVKIDRATGAYLETWTDAAKLEISTVRNGSCAKTDAPTQRF